MKTITQIIIGAVVLLFASVVHSFAIEGLQVSVPSTNAVLSWPSDPSETYIVQYRNTLNATDSWTTLTDYFPASSTNITFFIDSNPLQYGSGGGTNGGGGGGSIPGFTNGASGGSIGTPGTGFYRVVRDGAHLFGITNGTTLSGIVKIPVELANGSGTEFDRR